MPRRTRQRFSQEEINAALDPGYTADEATFGGTPADYIPALAEVDPQLFSLVAVTADGEIYSRGHAEQEFAIESISRVFTTALAIKRCRCRDFPAESRGAVDRFAF